MHESLILSPPLFALPPVDTMLGTVDFRAGMINLSMGYQIMLVTAIPKGRAVILSKCNP